MIGAGGTASRRDTTISFGKHKGQFIRELDSAYLRWMMEKARNVPPQEREAAIEELEARGVSAPPASTRGVQIRPKAVGCRGKPADGMTSATESTSSLMRVQDVAKMLNVSVRSVWRMRDDGRLPPPRKLGKQTLRWDRNELEKWIALRKGEPPGMEGGPCQPTPTDDKR